MSTNNKIQSKEAILKEEERLRQLTWAHGTDSDPKHAFSLVREELDKGKDKRDNEKLSKLINKAVSLDEFNNGILMTHALPEEYRTFCIEFSRNLQKEYCCETPSEKATAELVSVNFVRSLEAQRKISNYLSMGEITDMGVRYLAVMSKELDKANRHYLNALQTLRMLKQPRFEVNIKAQTAVVGQNQIVQSNNK